jgi:hypothetical protein
MLRKLSLLLVLAGCNQSPLDFVPADFALPGPRASRDLAAATPLPDGAVTQDLSMPDLSIPPRPCTLMPAGDPVTTVSYAEPANLWKCEGVLALSGTNHVIHYGNAQLRHGGWSDPAIVATELDVSTWPPVTVRPATEFWWTMHSPAWMFELTPDKLGLTWSTDTDGVGPVGVQYRTIDAASWAGSGPVFLSNYMLGSVRPVPLAGGQFATTLHSQREEMNNNILLAIVDSDGVVIQKTVLSNQGSSFNASLERTQTDLLVASAYGTCPTTDPMACEENSLVLQRVTGGTTPQSPLKLEKVTSIAARNPKLRLFQPILISDRESATFLTWWETGDTGSYLFATPLSSTGQPAGPVEVWFTNPFPVFAGQPSLGRAGVVVPVISSTSSDAGSFREVHLVQRELLADAPVHDHVFQTLPTAFAVATAQLANPRALIVGYSDYIGFSGQSGHGVLAKYVCAED